MSTSDKAEGARAGRAIEARSAADAAIEARGVVKRYAPAVIALDRVDVDIRAGTITALVGANGSGKSTLLRILAGSLRADEGAIAIGGRALDNGGASRLRTGLIAQSPELDPEMGARATLELFATLHGIARAHRDARSGDLVSWLALSRVVDRPVASLSGGERQRLHLAVGLVPDPDPVFMDEPTGALDVDGRDRVWRMLARARDDGRTAIVATHDLDEASRCADSIVLLHAGRVVVQAPPKEIIAAHGATMVDAEVDTRGIDATAIRTAITAACCGGSEDAAAQVEMAAARPGSRDLRVEVDGSHVRVLLRGAPPPDPAALRDRVVGALEKAGHRTLAWRSNPPDLRSAYFSLTGAAITPTSADEPAAPGRGMRNRTARRPAMPVE